ncbi:hypothetical protein EAE91_17040 [Photorhabdus noenieputensis]|nr:hypothetical protein [Photorhabdus noenieputensis]
MSFCLPDIVKTISSRICYKTGKGNFFTIELTNDNGETVDYEIYFKVSRESRGKLRLFVESAYVRDNDHGTIQPQKKKINFFVIAHNIQVRKFIKQKTSQ